MKFSALSLVGIASLALASPLLASGTVGGGSQGAQMGQKVYTQKITCGTCMYPGGIKDVAQAKQALMKIENGDIKLSMSEKKAVTSFIKRRFKGA
jgi:hypothetical protein